jgi:hypothetical protein
MKLTELALFESTSYNAHFCSVASVTGFRFAYFSSFNLLASPLSIASIDLRRR